MKLNASRSDPPLGAVLTCLKANVSVEWGKETSMPLSDTLNLTSSHSISRHVARVNPTLNLYPAHILQRTEVDHWLSMASGPLSCVGDCATTLGQLNNALAPAAYLVDKHLTVADIEVFASLYCNGEWKTMVSHGKAPVHVLRWYNCMDAQMSGLISSLPSDVTKALSPRESSPSSSKKEDRGKFVELPGAKMGEVCVRFPPEASGYLHIGHAKAALLNQYYQKEFKGKLVMRFDDTNPEKEKDVYEKVILEDLKLLEIYPDVFTHTSDHFDRMLEMCEGLIKKGVAYCDDTDPETMKKEREERKEGKNYNNTVEKNLTMWNQMKQGAESGLKCCVRAKIDMKSNNGCMRDPTIYRCKLEPHVRTGDKYKVYPTYDFACPIVDSVEGITHALRTTEYHDRDDQYFWFIEKLGLRKPYIYEYSRLNMNNTVLSKRKLTWFVDEGLVDGWDDPRFPTVRGILRHGMTVEGLKDFIVAQGSSRSVNNMEWDKIWSFNKKVIDGIAPRFTALQGDLVPVNCPGLKEEATTAQKHPKDSSIGTKTVWVGPKVLIESVDAEQLKEGQNATFINWGNITIKKINRQGGKIVSVDGVPDFTNTDYKKTLKLTWLAETEKAPFIPVVCVYFDHLVNKSVLGKEENFKDFIGHQTRAEVKMMGDPELANLKAGDIIQIQRKGFFRVDESYKPLSLSSCREGPIVLFYIPDGHSKDMPTGTNIKKLAGMSEKEKAHSAKGKKAEKSPQEEVKPVIASTGNDPLSIHNQVTAQGDKIRQLKANKADKTAIKQEVDLLLSLKKQFQDATGQEWKPDIDVSKFSGIPAATPSGGSGAQEIHEKIKAQGDKVRELKTNKADKDAIKKEVDILLACKKDFKNVTGSEWKPDIDISKFSSTPSSTHSKTATTGDLGAQSIHESIKAQGEKVRELKTNKADKDTIKKEVDILLAFKKDFKNATGADWKPDIDISQFISSQPTASGNAGEEVHNKIKAQGDKIRSLKSSKADKNTIKAEVDILLALKKEFKDITGKDWVPDIIVPMGMKVIPVASAPAATKHADSDPKAAALKEEIDKQGNKVRDLKSKGADKAAIDAEVKVLLSLKQEYKNVTGTDLAQGGGGKKKGGDGGKENKKPQEPKKEKSPNTTDDHTMKKQTRLGLEAKKEENLSEWYSQVITKSEMIEYYNVSGCYILRPWSYAIWDFIKDFFDAEIKKLGVVNAYFPIFVAKESLEREKDHIADFSPEVAWVTKSGSTDMAEPVAIRPTSETVMYPSYAKWIQSHRDLPMKLNQWNNVVRWEFKQPTPFLRTREFLWQEGHTAFATKPEADEEVLQILDLYRRIYEELLAIPVVRGKKTEKEKFAGGDYTTTTEAFISASGRAIQGATSHHLGQNFSKMFDIIYEDPVSKEKKFVYQNSWGITTRTIGVMVMVHGDDKGLVLPPRIAQLQVVIMPVGITAKTTDEEKNNLLDSCKKLETDLIASGVRTRADMRDNVTPGWKFSHWELKGVPLRLELGPREVAAGKVFAVRRDTGEKQSLDHSSAGPEILNMLTSIQNSMFQQAKQDLDTHKKQVHTWEEFTSAIDSKNLMLAPFCGAEDCEDLIKKESAREEAIEAGAPAMGAKSLCIPFDQPGTVEGKKCIHPRCNEKPKYYTLFGRSY